MCSNQRIILVAILSHFGSCNVALLCDNLIIENYGNRCFARHCAETSVFTFHFDFARMGGTLWSLHTKAMF